MAMTLMTKKRNENLEDYDPAAGVSLDDFQASMDAFRRVTRMREFRRVTRMREVHGMVEEIIDPYGHELEPTKGEPRWRKIIRYVMSRM